MCITTLTVDIDNANDLAAAKNSFAERGLNYEVEEEEDFIYTDELKKMLDEDEEAFQRGDLKLITPEESRKEIRKILYGLK